MLQKDDSMGGHVHHDNGNLNNVHHENYAKEDQYYQFSVSKYRQLGKSDEIKRFHKRLQRISNAYL
jgi:hypothetical protein